MKKDYLDLSIAMRRNILRQTFVAGVGHTGGALSMVEILIAIYAYFNDNHSKNNLPNVIISKGHAAAALYAWLAENDIISYEDLDNYRALGSNTQSHVKPPSKISKGIEGFFPSGSLTHGLSIASGVAIALRSDDEDSIEPVFCVLGDTELQGGQNWETAIQISFHKLNNIVAIVDDNGFGNDYATRDTLDIGNIAMRFKSCGWSVFEINDGHNVQDIISVMDKRSSDSPTVIIAKTIKGKGITFMENNNIWHGTGPNKEQFVKANVELGQDQSYIESIILKRDKRREKVSILFPREKTLRDSAADALMKRMSEDERIIVIAPELAESTRAGKLARAYPKRVYNLGVQEPNAMDIVAGLAFSGKVPVIITFTNFVLLRTVDQIFQNIAPFCKNLLIVGTHDGLLEDGMSVTPYNHFAIARSFYGSKVFCPADYYESKSITNAALDYGGYSFIFNSRETTPILYDEKTSFKVGVAKVFNLKENYWTDRISDSKWYESIGTDLNVIVAGAPYVWLAKEALKKIASENISVSLINCSSIKPLDIQTLDMVLGNKSKIIVIEKHSPLGGLYSAIAEYVVESKKLSNTKIDHFPKKEWVGQSGSPDDQIRHYGYDPDSIEEFIKSALK